MSEIVHTDEYREACGGTATDPLLNFRWRDKPHQLVYDLCAEIDRLARWKEEALHVLGQWDLVGVALGGPGALGQNRAAAALDALAGLAAERDRLMAELEVMRARGGDRARLTCPQCTDEAEELPVIRCIKCGAGYWFSEEDDR